MEFDRAIALYMNNCHARQLRPKTLLTYEQAHKLFIRWLEDERSLTSVQGAKVPLIRSCILSLQKQGKYMICANNNHRK